MIKVFKIPGIKCNKCYNDMIFVRHRGPHLGFYCADCLSWIKWANVKEKQYYEQIVNK